MPKKLKSPYFVRARVLPHGAVELVDDDGEIYHVAISRDTEWPIVSRQVRRAEMRASMDRARPVHKPPPPPVPFKPKLVS